MKSNGSTSGRRHRQDKRPTVSRSCWQNVALRAGRFRFSAQTSTSKCSGRYLQIEVNRGLPARYLLKHFTRVGLDWQLSPTIRSRSLLVLGAAETTLNLDDNYVRVPYGAAAFYRLP